MDLSDRDAYPLGRLLRDYRRAGGLTQRELARRAGVSLGTVRDLEQGRTRRPLPGSAAALASALGLSTARIGELAAGPPAAGLLLRVLGPLGAWRDEAALLLGGVARQAVLGMLAMSAGCLVHREAVIDVLWPEDPPARAVGLVQAHVSRLRRLLDPGGLDSGRGSDRRLLVTDGASYRLQAGPGQLDLLALGELTAEARAAHARGDDEAACRRYQQALGLWRGEPLANVDLLRGHPGVIGLSRQRADLVTEYARVASAAGWHDQVVSPLRDLTSREPLNEQAHAQLMIGLAGCGQQAEALAIYQDLCRRLDQEFAMPPSPDLARAHQRVLRQDISPVRPAGTAVTVRAAQARPQAAAGVVDLGRGGAYSAGMAAIAGPGQLPASVAQFVGREHELRALDELLGETGAGGTAVISAIAGTAGVGKTALAVRWARRAAASFADGQLYVNLRGYDSSAAVPPAEALGWFLEALGVAAQGMPASLEARAALFRSLVAGRQLLIVLDNAKDPEQVRPLLPGAPGCLVLVTSRASLAGLAVSEGAHLLTLDVLSVGEAGALLERRIGSARAAAEPGAVNEMIRLCAGLPLALAIVAARACARPGFPLAGLAAELSDESGRLDALDSGDRASSISAVFSWSYRHLSGQAARMFRLLGLHPGPDVTAPAAASAAGVGPGAARRCLRELTDAHLLSEQSPGRYGFHDLLRAYAASQAAGEDQHARHESTGRILDHYLHTAAEAALVINPGHDPITVAPPRRGVTPEPLSGPQQALVWLRAEHQVLIAATTLAASSGFDTHAWQIPQVTAKFMCLRRRYRDMATAQSTALAAATRMSDTARQAESLRLLAYACAQLGEHDQALAHYAASLRLFHQLGDRLGQARVHWLFGVTAERLGRYADALTSSEQALRLYQAAGYRAGEAAALNNVGYFRALHGDYGQARMACREALNLAAELGLRHSEACAWDSLGYAEHHLGDLAEATACYQRALTIVREFGDPYNEATILTHLGDTRQACGQQQQARQAWQQALDILSDLHHPDADQVQGKLQSPA